MFVDGLAQQWQGHPNAWQAPGTPNGGFFDQAVDHMNAEFNMFGGAMLSPLGGVNQMFALHSPPTLEHTQHKSYPTSR